MNWSDPLPWALVGSLSLAQLVSWGTIFYAFTLFMDPMTRELGWSKPEKYWDRFTTAEHSLWDKLFEQQTNLLRDRAAPEFTSGIEALLMG